MQVLTMHASHVDLLNERRFWLATGGALWVLVALVMLAQMQTRARPSPPPVQRTMELVLEAIQLPAVVTPPPAPPPVVAKPVITPKSEPPPREAPRVEAAPVAPLVPQPVAQPAAPPAQQAAVPAAAPAAAVVTPAVRPPQPEPPAPAALPAAAPEVARPAPPVVPAVSQAASVETGFVAQLRAQLNASKRYPTGREASMQRPSGRVVVWFVLNRSGQLQDVGIVDSSNSILLDNAALTTVRRANFPAWPEAAWAGQSTHRFTATLDFIPQS